MQKNPQGSFWNTGMVGARLRLPWTGCHVSVEIQLAGAVQNSAIFCCVASSLFSSFTVVTINDYIETFLIIISEIYPIYLPL